MDGPCQVALLLKNVPATGEAAQVSPSVLVPRLVAPCVDLCHVRASTSAASTTAGCAGDRRPSPHLGLLSLRGTDCPAPILS